MATNRYIIQLIVDTGSGQAKVKGVSKAFQDLDAQATKAEGSVRRAGKAMKNTAGSAGIAGAATAEFGRFISDLPYGIQAVTNNISQLGSMFALLVSSAGGAKNALNAILLTLSGPAGWLIAFQAAVSLLEYFSRNLKSAASAMEKMTSAQGEAAAELKVVRDLLERQIGSYSETVDIIERLNVEYDTLNLKLDKTGFLTRKSKERLDELIKSYEDAARTQAALAMIEDLYQEKLEKEVKLNRLRTTNVNMFAGAMEYLKDVYAGYFLMPELGRSRRIKQTQYEINKLSGSIDDIIQMVGSEGLINKVFGPKQFGQQDDDAVRRAFPFLSDDQLRKLEEQQKETREKEEERLQSISEMHKEYTDGLLELQDESGLVRLMHQERDAIAEAKALGASKDLLLRIERYYYEARQKLMDEQAEKDSKKLAKEDEKKRKEDEKKAKDAREANKKKLGEFFDAEIKAIKDRVNVMTEIFSKFGNVIEELDEISQARFQRQINQLKEQRDLVRTNENLTTEEKEKQLTDIQRKENNLQRERIKSERDMFALKQTFAIAEMIITERAAFRQKQLDTQKMIRQQQMVQLSIIQEQVKNGVINTLQAQTAITAINTSAAKNIAEANMSIGAFMSQLGPLGIIAFGASIVGVIASIISARKKAQAEIAGLSDAPISLGGSSGASSTPSGPAFNLIGTGGQSQLAQAVASQQRAPMKAYVVAGEVTTAQAMERNRVKEASI